MVEISKVSNGRNTTFMQDVNLTSVMMDAFGVGRNKKSRTHDMRKKKVKGMNDTSSSSN